MRDSFTTMHRYGQESEPCSRRRWVPTGVLRRLEVIDLDLLGVEGGSRALDVGCGRGRLMRRLGRRGCLVTGVDLIRADLLRARRLLEDVRPRTGLVVGDAGRLPFTNESFDFVTCTETLEHVADDNAVLRELARVLKPGGRLAVSVPDMLPELVAYHFFDLYRLDPWGHRRIYTRGRIVQRVRAAGLRVYARRFRNSVEAVYWVLLYLLDSCPLLGGWAVAALNRWRDRSNSEPYSLFYHVLDQAGNRLLPKSIVVYAEKPQPDPLA